MHPRPTARPRATVGRAFTLVEILVVMLLISVLAVAAAPTLGSIPRQKAAAASRLLMRDLGYARERAMTDGARTWVTVSVASDQYSVLQENPAAPGRAGAATVTDPATRAPFIQRLSVNATAGVDVTAAAFGPSSEVGFDRLGRPLLSTGALMTTTGTITLRGGHVVSVAPGTGRIFYTPGTGG
ncbi:MAG: GspH/FimT family pseudopilin [Phycisphaerales bacterium]